jgi:MFS family permease
VSPAQRVLRTTFEALRYRNYRLYFFGQLVSVSGTWMQTVAQAWLVLRLTGSGVALGSVVALQFLPMLLVGAWGGLIADRFDKRRLLLGTQTFAGLLALTLGLLTVTGTVQLWMVFALAFGLGCVNVVDNPTRQAFVVEMVGSDSVTNAVSLNSVIMNSARVVGPAVAGILIAVVDVGPCFLINAASYVAVIVSLLAMRPGELHPGRRAASRPGQLRAGFRYVWSNPELRTPLLLMVVIGTLAYEFQVSLPLMARFTFHSGAAAYGAMSAFMGAGAVVGGLVSAARGAPTPRRLRNAALMFGILILGVAAMPTLGAALAVLPFMGGASISFIAMANSTLQLRSAPELRGRVMALYGVAFLGSTPVGGPIVGLVGETLGPRAGVGIGGVATLVAIAVAWRSLSSRAGPRPVDAGPAAVLASDARVLEAELAGRSGDTEGRTPAEPATGPDGNGRSPGGSPFAGRLDAG